jgi:hypothetical protein
MPYGRDTGIEAEVGGEGENKGEENTRSGVDTVEAAGVYCGQSYLELVMVFLAFGMLYSL